MIGNKMCPLCHTPTFILGIIVTIIVFKHKWILKKLKSFKF